MFIISSILARFNHCWSTEGGIYDNPWRGGSSALFSLCTIVLGIIIFAFVWSHFKYRIMSIYIQRVYSTLCLKSQCFIMGSIGTWKTGHCYLCSIYLNVHIIPSPTSIKLFLIWCWLRNSNNCIAWFASYMLNMLQFKLQFLMCKM